MEDGEGRIDCEFENALIGVELMILYTISYAQFFP